MDALLALTVRSGRILKVSLPDGDVEPIYDAAGPAPDGIVAEHGVVYWTTMGAPIVNGPTEAERDYSRADGAVHSVGLDGCGYRQVVPTGAVTTGKQLTSDGDGTLYWADREGCRVSRVRTDGSGRTDLVIRPRDGGEKSACVGVAVDPARGHLYWTQKGPAKGGRGRIFRAGLELPAGRAPSDRTDIELLWDHLPEPIDLHLAGNWLYWTDRGAEPWGNTLNRARIPAPGEPGEAPTILAAGFREAIGLTVDADAGIAYASDLSGRIRAIGLPGRCEPTDRVLLSLPEPITGLAGLD
jgi:hypothetical protein